MRFFCVIWSLLALLRLSRILLNPLFLCFLPYKALFACSVSQMCFKSKKEENHCSMLVNYCLRQDTLCIVTVTKLPYVNAKTRRLPFINSSWNRKFSMTLVPQICIENKRLVRTFGVFWPIILIGLASVSGSL